MIPSYTLASGHEMPAMGLGTGTIGKDHRVAAIRTALELGYPLVDTADSYNNHDQVAEGMKGFDRESIFISSKVPADQCHYDDVIATCEKNLGELQTDYIDMYLIHSPAWEIPLEETFAGLAEVVKRGWVRSVGVSNFGEELLAASCDAAAANGLPLSNNQLEVHPLLYDWELLDFCAERNIVVTAYGPLAVGRVFENETLVQVAAECGRDVSQVTLRWLLHKGTVPIPASKSPEHLAGNLQVFEFELTADQIERIDAIDEWVRVYAGKTWKLRKQRTPREER